MPRLLLNTYIVSCKLMVCTTVFVATLTHYWFRDVDEAGHKGLRMRCFQYGSNCYQYNHGHKIVWFFCGVVSLNLIFELLNVLLLWKRTRARINLILEEISLLTTLIFLAPAGLFCLFGIINSLHPSYSRTDWSFFVFYIASTIALIDFVCSIVSYCRENSFRSNVIKYSSNQNQGTVHIQSA
ncbi:unnamed protein product [Adineta ricciae]|uniref:Uncharacterized protein n=1 Tax=Adineta ricciae TaxID=249248 RepID=A0A816CNT3_ADIRI|nr:unnamed protein product [Adineta ricciae]CAF1623597.1 unnamed protein product [Adineta ricciae]